MKVILQNPLLLLLLLLLLYGYDPYHHYNLHTHYCNYLTTYSQFSS